MVRAFVVCFILAVAVAAFGETSLRPVHPDEPADYTLNERLSTDRSLESLDMINSALDSFRKLTEATAGTISKTKLAEIGNTGWEMQNLGFVNHVGTVRGTLLKQDYLIKKLTYELAQEKSKSGVTDQKALLKMKDEYEQAEKRFQEFWNTFSIAD